MTKEKELLIQAIKSGQVSAKQLQKHIETEDIQIEDLN